MPYRPSDRSPWSRVDDPSWPPSGRGRRQESAPGAGAPPVPDAAARPACLDVAAALTGERILITGATGFLGKTLVEKLLRSVPEVDKLHLLVRPGDGKSAQERLRDELLGSPIMAHLRALHAGDWQRWAESKIEVVPGDLARDRFGLDDDRYAELCAGIDRVVACAATVTFDERLDRALELNARGAARVLRLARDAGDVPLLHVSTCYVSGRRQGWIDERVQVPEGDGLEHILAQADSACARLRAESRADEPLVAAGIELADRHGFHDVYTFTKALGERLLARDRGTVPVAIVRPAIVESAAAEPIPGWIDAVRVADPLLVAYGRGRVRDIPGATGAALELIPVDYVVNATLAALADLRPADPGAREEIRVYQVGSSRHPISLGELMAWAREGFVATPLRDDDGRPIAVGAARFVEPERLRRRLLARRRRAGRGEQRTLEHFLRLLDVYRPYFDHGARYRDDATLALWHRLSDTARQRFPFDVAKLDWRSYVAAVHVPGIVRFALKADSGAPAPAPPRRRPTASAESVAAGARTLFELFSLAAREHPDTVALQTCRGGRWLRYTYAQALTATANVAHRLARHFQIEPGDRVVLWSSGCPEWTIATFAAHRLGAVTVPLDPQWPAREIEQAARLVGAKLICAAPRLIADLEDRLDAGLPLVELAAPLVPEPDVGLLPGAESVVDTAAGSGFSDHGGAPAARRRNLAEDLASIIFTSGTTVAPKAVPLTHANYLANVRDLVPLMRLERERLLSVLPIHHVFEQMVGLLVPLAGGSTISYVAEIKPAEISWMMNVTRPTVLVAVPRLLELLHGGIMANVAAGGPGLKALFKVLFVLSRATGASFGHRLFAKVHRRFGGCLRRIATGGSALPPSLGRSFQLMGFSVAEGYGMTETSPVLTVNPWREIRFGSVGRPLPGVEIDLRSPADAAGVDPGEGEVWVRGANVMAGYYQDPEATARVLADGWLNTGDIGRFDDDGYLYLSGRTKDVIVTAAGKNVYPEEVEARYRGLPEVEELVVLGLPADGGGERVCALVVPRPDAAGDDVERIRSAIAERSAGVPSYQQVSSVEIWRGDLPKTTTMKVKRAVLRDAVLAGQRGSGEQPAAPPPAAAEVSYGEAETWVLDTLARLTGTRADLLSAAHRLADLGVDSLTRVELIGAIEERFELRLDDTVAAGAGRVQDLFDLV